MELINKKYHTVVGDFEIDLIFIIGNGKESLDNIVILDKTNDTTYVLIPYERNKDVVLKIIQSTNLLLFRTDDFAADVGKLRFFPRFKFGDKIHLSSKDTIELMDFIIFHLKPEFEKRDSIIDSLLSEE